MKLIFLLAFVALASGASLRPEVEIPSFPKKLEYQYDAQVATGMQEVSDDYSTMRLRFKVLMRTNGVEDRAVGSQRWQISFEEVNIRQRLNATEDQPKTLLPMSQFRNLENSELWFVIRDQLKKPFEADIIRKSNSIIKVFFSESDQFWSTNIKKGFLQTLQFEFLPAASNIRDSVSQGNWIKEINEMSTADKCKTRYVAQRTVNSREVEQQRYNVEKIIDFNDCINRINANKGQTAMWSGVARSILLPQQQQQQQQQIVDISNVANYEVNLHESLHTTVIRKAAIRTVFTISPLKDSLHTVIALQQLQLINAEDSSEMPALETEVIEFPEGLRLSLPQERTLGDREITVIEQQTVELLKIMLNKEPVNMKVYERVLRTLRSHLNKETQLKRVAELLAREENKQQLLRAFILDLCPQVASQGSVQFLMQIVRDLVSSSERSSLIRDADLKVSDIHTIFVKLGLMGNIQVPMMQAVFDVVKSDSFSNKLVTTERMPIFKAGWLCLGAMVDTYFGRQAGVEQQVLQSLESKTQYFSEDEAELGRARSEMAEKATQLRRSIVEFISDKMLKQQSNDAIKFLGLKVVKNAGLFEVYEQMSRIFFNTHGVTGERVEAIYASRKMMQRSSLSRLFPESERLAAKEFNQYVRSQQDIDSHLTKLITNIESNLLSVFRNVSDDPEVRIAAYRVLIQSPISKTSLNSLLQHIMSEPTEQVSAYCVEHLQQISQKSLPRYHHVTVAVRAALSQIKSRQPKSQIFSRVFHTQMWDELHEAGFSVEADVITSDTAFTPRFTHIRLDHQSLGKQLPVLEISVRTEGLQQILEKFFGPRGLFYKNARGVMKMLRRFARSAAATAAEDSMKMSDLQIVSRILKEIPSLDLSISVMGNDLIDFSDTKQWTSRTAQRLNLANCLRSVSQLMQSLSRSFTIGSAVQLPTPVGTFLDMNALLSIDFRPVVQLNTEIEDAEEQTESMTLKAKIALPLKVRAIRIIGCNMHVLEHFQQFEDKLETNKDQKIAMNLRLDASNKKASFELDDVETIVTFEHTLPKHLLTLKTKAKTIIREGVSFEQTLSPALTKNLKHRQIAERSTINFKPTTINSILSLIRHELVINGQTFSGKDLFKAPCWYLLGPSRYTISLRPTEQQSEMMLQYKLKVKSAGQHMIPLVFDVIKAQFEIKFVPIGSESVGATTLMQIETERQEATNTKTVHTGRMMVKTETEQMFKFRFSFEQPEDLKMQVRSLPLSSVEWIQPRTASLMLEVTSMSDEKVVSVHVQMKSNPELARLLKETTISQQQMLSMFPMLRKCVKEAKQSLERELQSNNPMYTPSCVRQYRQFNQLNAFDISFKYNKEKVMQRCSTCQVIVMQLHKMLQANLVQYQIQQQTDNILQKVIVSMRPSTVDSRVMHMNVSCPWAKAQWRSIQLPVQPLYWDAVENATTAFYDYVKGGKVACQMMNSHVRTFDDVVYSLPEQVFRQSQENSCPVVLARDCSKKQHFQVKRTFSRESTSVKVHLKTGDRFFVVEFIKSLDGSERMTEVRAAGRVVDSPSEQKPFGVIESRQFNFHERNEETKQMMNLVIRKLQYADSILYELTVRELQLQVLVGGTRLRRVEIRASPFYHNKICGLCGDYNSETFREFKGVSEYKVMRNPEQLFKEFIDPVSESCSALKQSADQQKWQRQSRQSLQLIQRQQASELYREQQESRCEIQNGRTAGNKFVKTVTNARINVGHRIFQNLIQNSQCALKVAEAKINEQIVRLYLKPTNEQDETLLIQTELNAENQVQEFESKTTALSLTSNDKFNVQLEDITGGKQIKLISEQQHITVQAFEDGTFVILASELTHGLCGLSSDRQLRHEMLSQRQVRSFVRKFTSAHWDRQCKQQIENALPVISDEAMNLW